MKLSLGIFSENSWQKNIRKQFLLILLIHVICNDPKYKPFVDNDHGHVITGNLKTVNNPHLQKLMKFGTKFRLP